VKLKAGIELLYLQVIEHQRFPDNHQKLRKRHGTNAHAQTSEGTHRADALIWDF
jgi:hypothetical protein